MVVGGEHRGDLDWRPPRPDAPSSRARRGPAFGNPRPDRSPATRAIVSRPSSFRISPCSRIALRCAPRATTPTSSPASASRAARRPPIAPAPITQIRMGNSSSFREPEAGRPSSNAAARRAQRPRGPGAPGRRPIFQLTERRPSQDKASRLGFPEAFSSRPSAGNGTGGVSRAAKGADCKSAGLAFVGSSPASPAIFLFNSLDLRRAPDRAGFMLQPVAQIIGDYQRFSENPGEWTRHGARHGTQKKPRTWADWAKSGFRGGPCDPCSRAQARQRQPNLAGPAVPRRQSGSKPARRRDRVHFSGGEGRELASKAKVDPRPTFARLAKMETAGGKWAGSSRTMRETGKRSAARRRWRVRMRESKGDSAEAFKY